MAKKQIVTVKAFKRKASKLSEEIGTINARIVRRRLRKKRILPMHVFRDVQAYKHIKKCKSCGIRFEDKYKARLYCDQCRK